MWTDFFEKEVAENKMSYELLTSLFFAKFIWLVDMGPQHVQHISVNVMGKASFVYLFI